MAPQTDTRHSAGKEITGEVEALNLGHKIRQLRRKKNLTLQNISDLSGLSKSLLSQIENSFTAPPIATLLKISRALDVKIGYFFQDPPVSSRIAVVRHTDRKETVPLHNRSGGTKVGYQYESLAHPMADKSMEPFMIEIEPREAEEMVFYNHKGEEFLFVLDGCVEFRGADRVIQLDRMDCLYFDSSIPHALRGLDGKSARVIGVIYAAG
jgi:transcriptional regulator with XRE-family HTH domain